MNRMRPRTTTQLPRAQLFSATFSCELGSLGAVPDRRVSNQVKPTYARMPSSGLARAERCAMPPYEQVDSSAGPYVTGDAQ